MGIFIKRPLCLFCFCFIAVSLCVCFFGGMWRAVIALVFLFASIIVFILSRFLKKVKIGLITSCIALAFCAVASFESFAALTLPSERLGRLCGGEQEIVVLVLDEEYSSRYSSKYKARLEYAGGEECSADAYLFCEYEAQYAAGDRICFVGDVALTEYSTKYLKLPVDRPVTVLSPDSDAVMIGKKGGFDFDVVCAKIRVAVSDVLFKRLDFDTAAFSVGLLTGDMNRMDEQIVRDFRRTGLSHVMAVSGLHLVVLIGGLEFLFKRIGVKRSYRCVFFSFLSGLLLILSGFSGSACRSVIMLICAYLLYILSRESDALTSLGVSGFLMFLFSPSTVGDIGFWLSFLATFGLVTWLGVASKYLSVNVREGRIARLVSTFWGKLVAAVLTTFAANVFVCAVSWLVFGEMSLVSIVANLLVTPISDVYLFFIPIIIFLGWIPFLSSVFAFFAAVLVRTMEVLLALFSSFEWAVISLRYPFASVIIASFSAVLIVMLMVKLRRKYLILFPPIVAVAAFAVCFSIYYLTGSPRVSFVDTPSGSAVSVSYRGDCVLVDVGNGSFSGIGGAAAAAKEDYSTKFDALVLTHYHIKHPATVERFAKAEMLKKLYIPVPTDNEEVNVADDLLYVADSRGIELVFYERSSLLEIENVQLLVLPVGECEYSSSDVIAFFLQCEDMRISYADRAWASSSIREEVGIILRNCDVAVLGRHGPMPRERVDGSVLPKRIAVADLVTLTYFTDMPEDTEVILPNIEGNTRVCRIISVRLCDVKMRFST